MVRRAVARLLLVFVLIAGVAAGPASAQDRAEQVQYRSAADGSWRTATLHLPAGPGPFPAVVVLSLAGVDGLVDRMGRMGWAVLVPERRGMGGAPELHLQASFRDLADDVAAARTYLGSRGEIDGAAVGLVAQGGQTMVGMMAAVEPPLPAFVVLISPRGIPGHEVFRMQQRISARRRGLDAQETEALDRQVERLSRIVQAPEPPSLVAYRVRALLDDAAVRPRQSASLPADLDGQVHFFSSPWWRDFLGFSPDTVLVRVRAPILVLEGQDPFVPLERNLPPIRRSLEAAPADDVTLCVVEDRVEHAFPSDVLHVLEEWIDARARTEGEGGIRIGARPGTDPPRACLEDPEMR